MRKKKWKQRIMVVVLAFVLGFSAKQIIPTETVSVAQAGTKTKINQTKLTLCVEPRKQLKLTNLSGTEKKTTIKWKSSKPTVVAVSNKGNVYARQNGKAIIRATMGKKVYQCTVTVNAHSYEKKEIAPSKKASGCIRYTCKRCKHFYEKGHIDYNPTQEQVYSDMIALKQEYKEGMTWTNDNYYAWKGGYYQGGYGCAGFAFRLSDEAFGYLPVRKHKNFDTLKVGDILRMNNDGHSVIILEVSEDEVVVAEGNFNSSVHWGRHISFKEIKETGTYVFTRYPKK